MRVALVAPVALPIPPRGYGGTERVVALLASGLQRRGHQVTLFASGDSRCPVPVESFFARALSELPAEAYREQELRHVLHAYRQSGGFEVFHDHTKSWGTLAAALARVPVLTTVHNDLTPERRALYGRHRRHPFVALSRAQQSRMPGLNWMGVVHNAVPVNPSPVVSPKGDYLLFLGRICWEKGTHTAVRVAQELDMPLVIAGNVRDARYFRDWVQPHVGRRIRYVGEVQGEAKDRWLAGARALLFPVDWPEPFGLVPLEANAQGTPVVATRQGALPEVITEGVNGYLADSLADLVNATEKALRLSPGACQSHVASYFSADRMVDGYLAMYRRLVEGDDHAA